MSWDTSSFRSWNVVKYVDLRTKQSRVLMEPGLMVMFDRNMRQLTVTQSGNVIEQISFCSQSAAAVYRDTAIVFTSASPSLFIKFRIRLANTADRYSLCVALSEFIIVQESLPAQKNTSFSQDVNISRCSSQACQSWPTDTLQQHSSQHILYGPDYCFQSQPEQHHALNQVKLSQEVFSSSPQHSQHLNINNSSFRVLSPYNPLPSQTSISPVPPPVKKICIREVATQTDAEEIWDASQERIEAELTRLLKTSQFNSLLQKIQHLLPKLQNDMIKL